MQSKLGLINLIFFIPNCMNLILTFESGFLGFNLNLVPDFVHRFYIPFDIQQIEILFNYQFVGACVKTNIVKVSKGHQPILL